MKNERSIELARLHLGPAHGPCRVTHAVDSELQTLYAAAYADGVKAAADVAVRAHRNDFEAIVPAILDLIEKKS